MGVRGLGQFRAQGLGLLGVKGLGQFRVQGFGFFGLRQFRFKGLGLGSRL